MKKEVGKPQNQTVVTAQTKYVGPLPHPQIFEAYARAVPDAPNRILTVFEEESAHTRKMEWEALVSDVNRDRRGQYMAFCIIMASLATTVFGVWFGKDMVALLAGMVSLVLAVQKFFGKPNNK